MNNFTNEKPKKIIIDTNVLIEIYAQKNTYKGLQYSKMNKNQKLLYLSDTNKIKLYITPQILKEFRCGDKNGKHVDRYVNFMKKFITIITFDEEQTKIIAEMTYRFGNERVKSKFKNGNEFEVIPFCEASKEGEKNYADTLIMAEATMAQLPVVTNNMKDFCGYFYLKPIVEEYKKEPQMAIKPTDFLNKFYKFDPNTEYERYKYNFCASL